MASEPAPVHEPGKLADEEIDRLLNQAAVLSNEVSGETRSDESPVAGATEEHALSAADVMADQLEQAGDEVGVASTALPVSSGISDDLVDQLVDTVLAGPPVLPPSTESPEPSDESPAPSLEIPPTSNASVRTSIDPLDVDSVLASVTGAPSPTDDLTIEHAGDLGQRQSEHVEAGRDVPEPTDEDQDEPDAEGVASAGKSLREPWKRRLMAALKQCARSGLHGLRYIVLTLLALPLNVVMALLLVLDWPFSRLSTVSKQRVGLIAVVTLAMGLVALLAPGLMKSNPYEHIGRFNSSVEHGGEPSAEHAGEPAAEHASAAPSEHEAKPSAEHE